MASKATRRRRIAALTLAAAATVSVGALTTSALYTDTDTIAGNTLSTGLVDIAAAPATAVFNATAMAPGDTVNAPITISNNGTTPLRYAMTSQTTEDTLAAGLQFTVRSGLTGANCSAGTYAGATTLYNAGVFGTLATTKILGDATQGAQTGDRALTNGTNEVLCLSVTLPTSAPNTLASKTTTATFTFVAEQTANNP